MNSTEQKSVPLPSVNFPLNEPVGAKRERVEQEAKETKRRKKQRITCHNLGHEGEFYILHHPWGYQQVVWPTKDHDTFNKHLALFPTIIAPTRGIKLTQYKPEGCDKDTALFLITHNVTLGGRQEVIICQRLSDPELKQQPLVSLSDSTAAAAVMSPPLVFGIQDCL